MHHLGKITGVIFALMISTGFWGVILGLIIGHMFDVVHNRRIIWFENHQERHQALFFSTIFEVMGHITKSKGQVTKLDIDMANHLMDRMNLHGESREAARNAFRSGKARNYPLREKMHQFYSAYFCHYHLIQTFLEIQIQVAFADSFLHPKERTALYIIAEELGISSTQFDQLLYMMQKDKQFSGYRQSKKSFQQTQAELSLEDACNILGVKLTDEIITIKRAYRKLMSLHHPDKLVAKGFSSKKMESAKKKAQVIQKAYELIKKRKKFK